MIAKTASVLSLLALLLVGCGVREDYEPYDCTSEFEHFLTRFDAEYRGDYLVNRLRARLLDSSPGLPEARQQVAALRQALAGAKNGPLPSPLAEWVAAPDSGWDEGKLPAGRAMVRDLLDALAKQLDAPDCDLAKARAEAATKVAEVPHPGFFTFATAADLPPDLAWETNLDAPEVGSPEARKGGTYHNWMPAFPPCIRVVGTESNNSFRSEHWDNVEMGLVEMHPDTGELIPGLADRWALGADGRTVFYHLDPEARFSDGEPVLSDNVAFTFYLQLNDYVNNPYGQNYYREQFTHFTRYDERSFSITLRQAKPLAPVMAGILPSPRNFYREIGPDFEKRYDWRCRPTTGAYTIRPEDIDKGKRITVSRVTDWWAKDRRYRRHRFNADRIDYVVIRDLPKAWEVFRKGDLEEFPLTAPPEYWYERSEVPEVFNGCIERTTFYNVWPGQGVGLYLNCAKPPLDNRDVRIGLQFACDYQRVIEVILRGDAVRANGFQCGYVLVPDAPVKARPYDPAKAREHFARAGYTQAGPDGILVNDKGARLSVAITTVQVASRMAVVNLLAEQAKKVGIEFRLDAIEGTSAFQKAASKQHQIVYTGWGFGPPFGDYRQYLHSENAFEKDGRPKTDTNNVFCYANPVMDALCERHRSATTLEELRALTWEIEQMVYDEGIFVPGTKMPFVREAHWRWLRWPQQHATAACYIPFESYVWWIDADRKKETLDAMRHKRKFPEVLEVKDAFRNGPPPAGQPEPAPAPPAPLPPS